MSLVLAKTILDVLKKAKLLDLTLQMYCTGLYIKFKIKNNIKVINTKYLPSKNHPRFILAGNHASAFDAYLIFASITGRYMRRVYGVVHERDWTKDNIPRLMLQAFGMIKREGKGEQIVNTMATYLLNNKTIIIPPEGMTSEKVMKGYTGIIRLYVKVNTQKKLSYPIPIIPIASIGATQAYPIKRGEDGKYHPQKIGIIGNIGKPIHFNIPKNPTHGWYREKTDFVMNEIARLALQKEGVIESWKQDQLKSNKRRAYK